MALVKTDSKHYAAIADAIRSKTGKTTTYRPPELPDGVEAVCEAGYKSGHTMGYAEGHANGFAIGEQAESDRFWEKYQNGGNRRDYSFAFASEGWTGDLLYPKYDIVVENGYQMFAYSPFSGSLKQRLKSCGVTMIFQGDAFLQNLFGYAEKITELGVIDFGRVTLNNNVYIFNNCTALQTIERLILPAGQSTWKSWFKNCTALQNVIFEGVIESGGLDLSESPLLSHDSLMSVISCLEDKSGTGTSWTVTLGTANLEKLSDSEKAVATQRGWTLA